MSCSTYLVLSFFLYFSISPWLPRVWMCSKAKCFYSDRRNRFSVSSVCMSCMYEQSGEGSYLTSSLAALSEAPCTSLQGGSPTRPLCLVLKRWRERNLQTARGTTYLPGVTSSKRGHEFSSGPCALLCDLKWQSWAFSQNLHRWLEVVPFFFVWHKCPLPESLQVTIFKMYIALLKSISYFSSGGGGVEKFT